MQWVVLQQPFLCVFAPLRETALLSLFLTCSPLTVDFPQRRKDAKLRKIPRLKL
jgi:hypothetical protein